jgi:hypothetical protein
LPPSTRLTKVTPGPVDSDGFGWHYVTMNGPLSVEATFGSTKSFAGADGPNARKLGPQDPVQEVQVTLGRYRWSTAQLRRESDRYISLISGRLGKPSKRSYNDPNEDPGHAMFSFGWYAEWRLSDGRTVFFDTYRDDQKDVFLPTVGVRFPYTRLYRS